MIESLCYGGGGGSNGDWVKEQPGTEMYVPLLEVAGGVLSLSSTSP